ncbi:hypothetical protein [Streptomyces cyaneochromogenes]|nr:hypothetical protein [Streptomyces cyaneochromogenes]
MATVLNAPLDRIRDLEGEVRENAGRALDGSYALTVEGEVEDRGT